MSMINGEVNVFFLLHENLQLFSSYQDERRAKDDYEDSDVLTTSSGHSSISKEHAEQGIISCSKHNGKNVVGYIMV